jgi:hypothetical protein
MQRSILVVLLILPAAAFAASGCDDLRGTPIHFNVDWQTQVKPIFNELISPTGRCTSCHNSGEPSGGMDISDDFGIDAIYKIVGNQVQPGDPLGSRLFLKVDCTQPDQGAQMPKDQAPLTIAERELIYDWIDQGARGEDPFDPIYRDFLFKDGAESDRQ